MRLSRAPSDACPIPVVAGNRPRDRFHHRRLRCRPARTYPTAAAELASPPRVELLQRVSALRLHSADALRESLENRMQRVDHLLRRMVHPGRKLQDQLQFLAQLAQRLRTAGAHTLERHRWQLLNLGQRQRARLPSVPEWFGARDPGPPAPGNGMAQPQRARRGRIEGAKARIWRTWILMPCPC